MSGECQDMLSLQSDWMQGMVAENIQKQELWERLEQARRAKAALGGYAGYGSPAFGQQSIAGELIENPDEQQIIELIRRHHKSGKSLQQVADWLNQSGYRTKRGQQWQRISVKRVLDRLYGRSAKLIGMESQNDE
jgi:DNA invertase Pin-like site-specific DNA recombinase